jgi:hypothetical protein
MLYVLTSIIDHRVRSAENIANDSSAEYEKKNRSLQTKQTEN